MNKLSDGQSPIEAKNLTGDRAREIVGYADIMLHAILIMKIDGWLTEEYDLQDQRDLLKAAIDYWACRHNRPKAPLTWDRT